MGCSCGGASHRTIQPSNNKYIYNRLRKPIVNDDKNSNRRIIKR